MVISSSSLSILIYPPKTPSFNNPYKSIRNSLPFYYNNNNNNNNNNNINNDLAFKQINKIDFHTHTKRETLKQQNHDTKPNWPKKDEDELSLKSEEVEQKNVVPILERKGRQLMKRSNLLAKQVISIQSALSLGFISQLWVDIISWVVLIIEVRPSLLSGEMERFFLEDVRQVGDVVLIPEDSMMENDLQVVGLETLPLLHWLERDYEYCSVPYTVGYDVITPGQQNIGKVRGYTFNINSGAVESLELDAFGISIIPSSLVSTYVLLVEDVLEVKIDTVIVHEAAALRIQRLTKGFWGSQILETMDEQEDYADDLEKPPIKLDKGRNRRRTSSYKKSSPRRKVDLDDWELPKDYL